MKRIHSIITACLLFVFTFVQAQEKAPVQSASKPNILFILADDLGYADLGCQGSKEIRTPHIDSLAKTGIRLTDAYVSAPQCGHSLDFLHRSRT